MSVWVDQIKEKKILLVMALPQESQGVLERHNIPVTYTGVGKLAAGFHLSEALHRCPQPPELVLNLGTAGSQTFSVGELVEASAYVDRDIDLSLAGFPRGDWPGQKSKIESTKKISNLNSGICGSGDHLEKFPSQVSCDLMDMEAYALAWVCRQKSIPFAAIKFITDVSNENLRSDWKSQLRAASLAWCDFLGLK